MVGRVIRERERDMRTIGKNEGKERIEKREEEG